MKLTCPFLFVGFCSALIFPLAAYAANIDSIMGAFVERTRDSFNSAVLQIKLSTCKYSVDGRKIRCTERPRVVVVETVQKDYGPKDRDTKMLAVSIAPVSEKGIGNLTYEYYEAGKDNDTWLYLPSLGKVKRLVSDSDSSRNFFGSEFLTESMRNRKLGEYQVALEGDEKYQGRDVWLVSLIPNDSKLKANPFSKIVSYIDKERSIPLKENFYNHSGKLYLQQVWQDYEKVDDVWVERKVSMNNFISKRVSHLETEHAKFHIDLSDEFFTKRSLTDVTFRERQMQTLRDMYR